jgi:hypothetical protein
MKTVEVRSTAARVSASKQNNYVGVGGLMDSDLREWDEGKIICNVGAYLSFSLFVY